MYARKGTYSNYDRHSTNIRFDSEYTTVLETSTCDVGNYSYGVGENIYLGRHI
jgi:hypothetical protein